MLGNARSIRPQSPISFVSRPHAFIHVSMPFLSLLRTLLLVSIVRLHFKRLPADFKIATDSSSLSISPADLFGSTAPRRGSIVFYLLKNVASLANGTRLTILGPRAGQEATTYSPITVEWVPASDPDGPALVWKVTNPSGVASRCRDAKFEDQPVRSWLLYTLAWDFDGISGAPRINLVMDRNTTETCTIWIDDGGVGIAESSNPVVIMSNPAGSTNNQPAAYLYTLKTYDEPSTLRLAVVWKADGPFL